MHRVPQHIHKRKMVNEKHPPYPHPDRKIKIIDRVGLIASIGMPMITIPQIYKMYHYRSASDVSLSMWILAAFFAIPLLTYGIAHKEKTIIALNSLWLVADAIIIMGVILYG